MSKLINIYGGNSNAIVKKKEYNVGYNGCYIFMQDSWSLLLNT